MIQNTAFGIWYALGDLFSFGCIVIDRFLDKTEFIVLLGLVSAYIPTGIGDINDLTQIVAGVSSDVRRIRKQQLAVDKTCFNALADNLIKDITRESCAVKLSAAKHKWEIVE